MVPSTSPAEAVFLAAMLGVIASRALTSVRTTRTAVRRSPVEDSVLLQMLLAGCVSVFVFEVHEMKVAFWLGFGLRGLLEAAARTKVNTFRDAWAKLLTGLQGAR